MIIIREPMGEDMTNVADPQRYLEDRLTCMYVLERLGWSSWPVDEGTRYEHPTGPITETVTIFTNGDATGSRSADGAVLSQVSGSASDVVMTAYAWSA